MGNFFKNILDGLSSAGSAVANVLAPDKALYQGLSAGVSSLLSSMGIDQSNKQNSKMLDKQMDFQREMFDKQLEANRRSIIDQYNQYKELGINPLSAQMSQTNMAGLPSSPSASPANFMSPLESAQVNLLNAEASKTRVEASAIDPEESRSRTEANRANAGYLESLSRTEDGMRVFKIRDAENRCSLTISQTKLTNAERKYYRKLNQSLDSQIQLANSQRELVNEQKQTEVFHREQSELMNKAQREHWRNEDAVAAKNAVTAANNVALMFERWQTEKGVYENQAAYFKQTVENLKKDGRLKDVEVSFAENTLDMRFSAFGAEWLYHISQLEDGTKRIELDLEYLNKHGGLMLKRQFAEDMNAFILGAFTPSMLNAKYGSRVVGLSAGGKILNNSSTGAISPVSPPPVPYHDGNFWYGN